MTAKRRICLSGARNKYIKDEIKILIEEGITGCPRRILLWLSFEDQLLPSLHTESILKPRYVAPSQRGWPTLFCDLFDLTQPAKRRGTRIPVQLQTSLPRSLRWHGERNVSGRVCQRLAGKSRWQDCNLLLCPICLVGKGLTMCH